MTTPTEQGDPVGSPSAVTRRRMISGAAGTVALGAIGAQCGTQAQPAGTQPSTSKQATIEWQIRGGPTYKQLADWATAQFKTRFPNVTVETSADNTGNFEKTTATMVAGSGPDILHGWGQLMVQYAAKGVMVNHNEYVKGLGQADVNDFVDQQWKGLVVPTTNFRYGVPTYVNMFVLFYNKSLFQQRGQREPNADLTYDQYADLLRQMTFEQGGKKVWGGFSRVDIYDRQFHVKAFGGHYVDPRDLTKTQLDSEASQRGLQWEYDRLFRDQSWAPIPGNRRTWQPDHQHDGFGQGVLATLEDGLHSLNPLNQRNQGFEWNFTHFPTGPAKRDSLVTTDSWAMWSGSKNKDVTWEFMKLLIGKEFYEQQARIESLIPSRKSVLETWVKVMKDKGGQLATLNYNVVIDGLTRMNYPTVDEVFQCQNEAGRIVGEGMNAVLVTGQQPPSHFRELKDRIQQAAASCTPTWR
jgi:multiple sugar transport system substrate-binding protein